MRWEEVLMTPEKAKAILDNSKRVEEKLGLPPNRRYEPKRASNYAKQIALGDWQYNGEDIHIAKSGRLLNGQHRLMAIIMSGKSVKIGIKSDVEDSVSIYDRGRTRSTSDTLTMEGLPKEITGNLYCGIVRLHRSYMSTDTYISDAEIERFILKHEDTFKQIHKLLKGKNSTAGGTRVNLKNTIILTGIMYAIEAGVDYEELNSFCEVLYTGIPKTLNQNAALVLRNDILSDAFKTAGGNSRKYKVAMVEKAIYDFVNSYPRKISYRNTTERIYSNLFKEE